MSRLNTVDLGAVSEASDDARKFGIGFLQILPDGTMTRIDPSTIMIADPNPIVCDCGMSGPCMAPECKWYLAAKESINEQS